ncbi:MAG: DegT/DnrJ/EryC1/StrS family aminotransferase [Bacteroidales bacterium]|jgi:dTDP-4-amino-4,6-dideoxygalactose transaminase|nr:DegT/DnrJ/EryC1/StrS family aminotransferase [Bacteroidales bacterium]
MIDYENLNKLNAPFETEFRNAFDNFLNVGYYILGQQTKLFEEEFASYIGAKHCIGVASGLDALELSLKVCEFPADSEIIVPSNTYIATILSIVNSGLTPILVEPNFATCNIDPTKIEEKITSKTKAIMVVHLYGKSCEMTPIQTLCKKYNLKLIEDCAQSHGAKYKGQTTGTFGDFGAFSFYPTKNLGALGDSGAITTNDSVMAEKLRAYRNYGSEKKYYNKYTGYNSRLDELQSAFLRVKLLHLDEINTHKRKLANLYFENINNSQILLPARDSDYFDVYHIFNIRIKKRDELKQYLLDNGIKTEIHYPISPNKQEGYQKWFADIECPISEEIHTTTLSLPCSFAHTENDILQVIDTINRFV